MNHNGHKNSMRVPFADNTKIKEQKLYEHV